jgi:hypothetical protein
VIGNENSLYSQKSYVDDSLNATYYISLKSQSVVKIRVKTIDKFQNKWITWYYLDSLQQPEIISTDQIDAKVYRRAKYFFKNGKLVHKKETNTKIDSPEKLTDVVKYLLKRMP